MLLKFGYHYGKKNVGARRRAQSTRIQGNDFIKTGRTFPLLHGSINWHFNSWTAARANDFET